MFPFKRQIRNHFLVSMGNQTSFTLAFVTANAILLSVTTWSNCLQTQDFNKSIQLQTWLFNFQTFLERLHSSVKYVCLMHTGHSC